MDAPKNENLFFMSGGYFYQLENQQKKQIFLVDNIRKCKLTDLNNIAVIH